MRSRIGDFCILVITKDQYNYYGTPGVCVCDSKCVWTRGGEGGGGGGEMVHLDIWQAALSKPLSPLPH